MHRRPIGLFTGVVCGMATGSVVAALSTVPLLRVMGGVLALVCAVRVVMAYVASESRGTPGNLARRLYPAGALVYAGVIGLSAAAALLMETQGELKVLLVGFAMTLGAGIAVGNAARPVIALGQMALTFLPISLACLALGTLPMVTMGLILPALGAGLTFVTFNAYTSLAQQVRTAQEEQRLAAQMQEQARLDPVTGLANRFGFESAAQALLYEGETREMKALLWLDISRFQEINDLLGHHKGDQVLAEFARRIRSLLPDGAVAARFGSDEFVLLLSGPSRRAVEDLAAQLGHHLKQPMRIGTDRLEAGVAIGIAFAGPGSRDLEKLMQHGALALFHAKLAGRSQIAFFNPAMTRELARRKEIESELRGAIQRDELALYFQPIIDLATGRIRAFEALVRWFHPEKGELTPDEFIPVAEDTGLIITLGNWITRTAARACASWPEDVHLAVNLSPAQLRAPGAALGITAALRETGLDPSRLELEVTESLFVEECHETTVFMEHLAAQGVRFSLDDFGTGYSSLHYINTYPFSTIKVDRSFVSGPATGLRTEAIIRAVAEMGATLGMEIVAEGLETPDQVAAVRAAGCTLGQGYYFSRPVPEHLALRLLEEERGLAGRLLAG